MKKPVIPTVKGLGAVSRDMGDYIDAFKYMKDLKSEWVVQPSPRPPSELDRLHNKLDGVLNRVDFLCREVSHLKHIIRAVHVTNPHAIEEALNYMDVKRQMDVSRGSGVQGSAQGQPVDTATKTS